MSEDPTRPIRPGEYGSPAGYSSSQDYGSRDERAGGYGPERGNEPGPGSVPGRGYGQGQAPQGGYGQGQAPQGWYGQGNAPDAGSGQGNGPQDGYGPPSGTVRMPDAGYQGGASPRGRRARRAARGRRRHRGLTITAIVVVVLLILLVVADRVAAGVAENEAASQIKSAGFPVKPKVTISGFPFLTQLAARDFRQVNIAANNVTEGPLDIASINATGHGVHLNSSFKGGTVDQVSGTARVTFAGLSHAAGVGDGITLSSAGNGDVKASIDLGFVSGSALAQVSRSGPHTINVRFVSFGGIPPSALGPLQDFTVNVPSLPAGMTIQNVSVTGQGLLISVAGTHTAFGQ
jgi:LmeA-like phospholipid-binding